eukprot:3266609-Prymnesium_polylepis.1
MCLRRKWAGCVCGSAWREGVGAHRRRCVVEGSVAIPLAAVIGALLAVAGAPAPSVVGRARMAARAHRSAPAVQHGACRAHEPTYGGRALQHA